MSEIIISQKAYTKIIFHTAKYPHLAVSGLLLGTKSSEKLKTEVVDAIPLFHQCLSVSPSFEIAFVQVEARAANQGVKIVGCYNAAENFYDKSTIEKSATGIKVADKIVELNGSASIVIVDNKSISMEMKDPGLVVWNSVDGKWAKGKYTLSDMQHTLDAVSLLIERGAMKDINDFDNYLDNIENEWTNQDFNLDLKQILSMK